ncbi:peptidoglycan DD-metalloendopeptidase family protein [Photobacterium leiognathi]|nr:peptidoglycan DD-metalloendopeptidase family protein [Photobacterium leiognathi]
MNFSKDIRNNDIFKVVLDKSELVVVSYEGKLGKITAYKNKDGMFYSAEGANKQHTSFLRKLLAAYRRISSRFNKNRLYSVTKRTSPHNGTDFAAPVGTPVFAGTSGTVIISKHKRLNGNYIVIKNGKYLTKYLHLSERKVKKGDRVQVGDEIGAVGNTGRSTGPHLHYEFYINGVPQDALTVKIPSNLKGADRSSGEINNLIDKYKQFL